MLGCPFAKRGSKTTCLAQSAGHSWAYSAGTQFPLAFFSSIFSRTIQACLQLSKLIYFFQSYQSQLRPFRSSRAHRKPIPCACVARIILPAMCVALHQALNFTCCLIAQLGVILQPFCQPLLDFLVSDLTCKCCHLTSQVFPKSSVVLATAQTLAEGMWG